MFRRFTNAFRANAILFSRILLIKILRDKVHKIVSQLSVIMLIVKRSVASSHTHTSQSFE